ncbi:hypothetical protein ACLB2K_034480 [Fragaria x ananassa]
MKRSFESENDHRNRAATHLITAEELIEVGCSAIGDDFSGNMRINNKSHRVATVEDGLVEIVVRDAPKVYKNRGRPRGRRNNSKSITGSSDACGINGKKLLQEARTIVH